MGDFVEENYKNESNNSIYRSFVRLFSESFLFQKYLRFVMATILDLMSNGIY